MRVLMICRLVAAGIFLSSLLSAQPYFFRKDFLVGLGAYSIVPGDFNGDEKTDLMVATAEGIYVVLNSGGGRFAGPIRSEEPKDAFWMPMATDFNGDGWDDLIGSGFLYLSRGDGTFLPPAYLGVQEAVAAADFNSDGNHDIVMSNHVRQEGVRILLGNGDGTFRIGATVTATPMIGVRLADFNRDGRIDVATLHLQAGQNREPAQIDVLVFLGLGDGGFQPEARTKIKGTYGFLVADFNGDELPDLLVSMGYGSGADIMLGDGHGGFQSPVAISEVGEFPLAAADFTGDGVADVVAGGERLAVCPSKGDGTLLPPVDLPMTVTSHVVAVADLDGDGRSDLAAQNYSSATLPVLMSRTEWSPELRRAMSSAGNTTAAAPGSLATLYAPTTATASEGALPPWPTQLGGIGLEVQDSSGVTRPAPLLFVSGTQINFRVPEDAVPGEAILAIAQAGGSTVAGSLQVEQTAPRLFTVLGTEVPAAAGLLVEPDGAQTPLPVYSCEPWPGGLSEYFCDFELIPLSSAGDRPIYLSFFGTGFRGANTDNVTCSVNGLRLPVSYAGPQETPGLDQINIQLLPAVLDAYDLWFDPMVQVVIRINGVAANPVWIMVQ